MADFEAWLVFLILVVNVVGELQRKRTLAASRGFLAAARLSCLLMLPVFDIQVCLIRASSSRICIQTVRFPVTTVRPMQVFCLRVSNSFARCKFVAYIHTYLLNKFEITD